MNDIKFHTGNLRDYSHTTQPQHILKQICLYVAIASCI